MISRYPGGMLTSYFFCTSHLLTRTTFLFSARKQWNFDNLDFRLGDFRIRQGERFVAILGLPDYGISHVRTRRFTGLTSEGRLSEARLR